MAISSDCYGQNCDSTDWSSTAHSIELEAQMRKDMLALNSKSFGALWSIWDVRRKEGLGAWTQLNWTRNGRRGSHLEDQLDHLLDRPSFNSIKLRSQQDHNEDLNQDRIKNDRAELKIQQDCPGGTIIVQTWEEPTERRNIKVLQIKKRRVWTTSETILRILVEAECKLDEQIGRSTTGTKPSKQGNVRNPLDEETYIWSNLVLSQPSGDTSYLGKIRMS
ncbi:unnamed protein product [Microthlaspi erraticum]|uniref:Uncharacterized protein n=1 Tax=Microthlaspi erraticum TaxID=1685480 RepID=A0A6D2K7E3_9BRAS|nr:unnamed protein product [Microthlaspi erraticum]